MNVDEPMQKLRDAFRAILTERMKLDFESGVYDSVLRGFIDGTITAERGDTIEIALRIQTVPDDIITMRILAGFGPDEEVTARVMAMWRRAREEP